IEDLPQIADVELDRLSPGAAPTPRPALRAGEVGVDAGLAELIVSSPLVLVGQDGIGSLQLLELRLGSLIAFVLIGVMLLGKPAIGPLDLVGVSIAGDAEDFVVIAIG